MIKNLFLYVIFGVLFALGLLVAVNFKLLPEYKLLILGLGVVFLPFAILTYHEGSNHFMHWSLRRLATQARWSATAFGWLLEFGLIVYLIFELMGYYHNANSGGTLWRIGF